MCLCFQNCWRLIRQFFVECCQTGDKKQQPQENDETRNDAVRVALDDLTQQPSNGYINETLTPDMDETTTSQGNNSTLRDSESADFSNIHLSFQTDDSFDTSGEFDDDDAHDEQIYTALFDYQARIPDDLDFVKSEQFIILSKKNSDWWYVRSLQTQKQGYIPRNYVAPVGSPEAIEWYYGDITRVQAENRLKAHAFPKGTFLVREAQNPNNQAVYSLSVLEKNAVRHYRIYKLDTGCLTINKKLVFPTLDELIRYHQKDADGLKCQLSKPYQEVSITTPGLSKDAWEINRGTLSFNKKIGSGHFSDVWLGTWNDNTEVAIKQLKKDMMGHEDFLKEAFRMKKMTHKNLVQLFAICSEEEPILIITEYLRNGALRDYLIKSLHGEVEVNIYHQIGNHVITAFIAWENNRGTLSFNKKIGSGHFSDVWLGTWNDNTEVAIKQLKKDMMGHEDFLKEAFRMKKMTHKNLVQLFAICSEEEPILIITEYLRNGALRDYLIKSLHGEVEVNIYHQIDMMSQISAGMAYLEAQNFVHRDLAARNILVGENNVYKICDFGLSRLLSDEGYYRANQNTKLPIKWLAIESAQRRIFTLKSDVWAFGIVMFEIITKGMEPYQGMANREVVEEIDKGYRMQQPKDCPLDLYAIMQQCWERIETRRPSFEVLHAKFQYLASIDNLEEKFMMN